MTDVVKRSDLHRRCAESHPAAKDADAIVVRARDLVEYEAMTTREAWVQVRKEGAECTLSTFRSWVYYRRRNTTARFDEG